MSRLEDRLFYRLEANLHHRDEAIEKYGHMIDELRTYAGLNDISQQLAMVLDAYRKKFNPQAEEITAADTAGYYQMHSKEMVLSYELNHGIKTFAFHISFPEENAKALFKKIGMPEWFNGAAIPPSFFKEQALPLMVGAFGIQLVNSLYGTYNIFCHESLHIDRGFYSQNFHALVGFIENPGYSAGLWNAKFQVNLADELFSFICGGMEKEASIARLQSNYWKYYMDFVCNSGFINLDDTTKSLKRKELEIILTDTKAQIGQIVDLFFQLKTCLDCGILTPISFALGPTKKEIEISMEPVGTGSLHGPFADIKGWAKLLKEKAVTPDKIKQQLQKKGYCKDSVIFSYLKR